jgi:1-acyl-sn-glycerol-3-phosphate acyltransferase
MLRSLLFAAAFYVVTALFLVLGSPLLLAPRSWAMAGLRAHARACLWLQCMIVGTRMEVRGREHLPAGPCLVAAKHQSAWDTFALVPLLRDPALVMKIELMSIPFYGWFSRKFGMIPIRREAGPSALRQLVRDARDRIAAGREVLIFPEGTRRAPGEPPDYKPGVVLLYESLGVACVPIALNSGLYWPRRSLRRHPGTIVVEFLEPLPAGLKRAEFKALLEARIEQASKRLIAEAGQSADPPPLPDGSGVRT